MADAAPPEPIRRYLTDHREDIAESTLDLLAFDTRNPPGDTRAAIDYLADELAAHGLDTMRYESSDDRPNIVVRIPGVSDRTFLFNGHVDTVDFDADEWTHDPLGERDDDRLYGRGATDMKGPLAAMLQVAFAYADTGTTPPVNLAFAFVSDEETGGGEGVSTLLEQCDVHADGCVIGETTCSGAHHSVTVADRGSIWLTLEATGSSAHGSRPMLGENAIDRLLDAVDDVRGFLEQVSFDLDPAVATIVDESVTYYASDLGETTARDLFEHPTVNLGRLEGGDAINTVPSTARAELDVRLSPGIETPDVLASIETVLDDHDAVTVADVSWSIGSVTPIDDAVVTAVTDAVTAEAGDAPLRRSATGGGDAKKFRRAGVPTVEFAFGTDTVHGVDEYTTVDALTANARIYASLPDRFAAQTTDP